MTLSADNIGKSDLSTIINYMKNKGKVDSDYIRFCWDKYGKSSIFITNVIIEVIRQDSLKNYGNLKHGKPYNPSKFKNPWSPDND